MHIRPTAGSVETIDLLNAGEVEAGFKQNMVYEDRDVAGLSTLVGLYYEPLWIFYRRDLPQLLERIPNFEGSRIGVGEVGSGTYAASTKVLSEQSANDENSTFAVAPAIEAVEQLNSGEIDVMCLW